MHGSYDFFSKWLYKFVEINRIQYILFQQRKDVDESVQFSSLPIAVPVVHEEDAFYEELRKALSE